MPATLYQHPRAAVKFDPPPADPREQPVRVVLPHFEDLTEDEMAVLDAQQAIERLADRLGSYKRLITIARTLASIYGEKV